MQFQHTAILGAGTIGASWAALFAATGRNVTVFDPSPNAQTQLLQLIENTAETLCDLGWEQAGDTTKLGFVDDPADAVDGADFIQESVLEKLDIKHRLYARIEPALSDHAIIGSSTSGLMLSQMQAGFANPSRFILAHPFNPPHLIPLVELMGNECTDAGVLDTAQAFYESIGKVCVRLQKEIPGHIANRLQAAIWRETIHLAVEGVASVEDIDKAVANGPGLRWAAMGPNSLLHLGGGAGGIRAFCEHLGGSFQSWWNDLGTPDLTPDTVEILAKGVDEMIANTPLSDLAAKRDKRILSYLLANAKDAPGSG